MSDKTAPAPAAPRRTSAAGFLKDTPPWAQPWLTCASAPPVAFLAHEVWGNDPFMHTGFGALAAITTGVTWATWGRRHEHTRLMATAFAGSLTTWTAVAANTPLTGRPLWDVYALGSIALSAAWNINHLAHKPAHESDKPSEKRDGLLKKIGGALADATILSTKVKPGRVVADVELKPGNVNEDAQQQAGEVASLAGLGKDQVTVVPNRRNARRAKLVFQDTENLREAIAWPGAGKLGRSVADAPFDIGMRADSSHLNVWICGNEDPKNPRQLPHTLTTGVNGSGKTETLNTLIIRIRETRDAVPIVGDPAKFAQSFGNVADALEIAAKGKQQVNQLIRNIAPAIEYRAEQFGNLPRTDGTIGYSQWEPELYTVHGFPLVFIDIEEATDVLSSSDDEFDEAIRKARSVGISINASLQTAHHGNIDRKTRGQFTNSLCHGCREDYDAKFSLSSATLDAGADPTKWANNYAGSLYGELVGTDPSTWATEARAYYLDRVTKRKELEASKANGHWAVLDPGTKAILGRGINMPDEKVTAMLGKMPVDKPEPAGQEPQDAVPDDAANVTVRTTDDGEQVDVSVPLKKSEQTFQLAQPEQRRMSTEDARALVESRINEIEQLGRTEVTFADLGDLLEATGRNRSWIYAELQRLESTGRLKAGSGRGLYRVRPRVNGFERAGV